jgi:hypothetical protein
MGKNIPRIDLPMTGTSFDASGTKSASNSKSTKNAENIFIPRIIFAGVSGGNQNITCQKISEYSQINSASLKKITDLHTIVRNANKIHGKSRMYE